MKSPKELYGKATTSLDHLAIWIVGLGLIFTACLYAAKASIFLFQFGWSTAFFVAAAATAFIMLAIAALLAAWRFFRPLSINPALDTALDEVANTQQSLNQLHDLYRDLFDQLGEVKASIGEKFPYISTQIEDLEATVLETGDRVTEAVRSLGSINPAPALRTICNAMDKIAVDTYGGTKSPLTYPDFVANEYTTRRFQILSKVAGDIISGAGIDLRVPSDAGICWWIPSSPGMGSSPDYKHLANEKLRIAMMMRCDHYQIWQYLEHGTTASKLMGG